LAHAERGHDDVRCQNTLGSKVQQFKIQRAQSTQPFNSNPTKLAHLRQGGGTGSRGMKIFRTKSRRGFRAAIGSARVLLITVKMNSAVSAAARKFSLHLIRAL
jgi:hypothetical protein